MLVSYDIAPDVNVSVYELQGHQNVGELRPISVVALQLNCTLQGHQNVGELRNFHKISSILVFNCKVTRMLVSYDFI